jgi:hypothetical protein
MDTLKADINGAVLKLLMNFHDKYDKDHSLLYTLEECLVAGIQAKQRSKEYSIDTQNRKKFERELAADPSVILHPDKMLRLCKKYGIAWSNGKLEEQVQAAAESMMEEETAPAKSA